MLKLPSKGKRLHRSVEFRARLAHAEKEINIESEIHALPVLESAECVDFYVTESWHEWKKQHDCRASESELARYSKLPKHPI